MGSKVVRVDWSFAVTAASSANNEGGSGDGEDRLLGNDNDTASRVNVRVMVADDEDDEEEEEIVAMEMRATALRALTRDLDVALAIIRRDDEK